MKIFNVEIENKNILTGGLTVACVGLTIAATVSAVITGSKIPTVSVSKDGTKENIQVDEIIEPVQLKKYLTSNVLVLVAEEFGTDFKSHAPSDKEASIDEVDVNNKLEPEKIVSIVSGYTKLGVTNTGRDYLNIRKGPGTSYKKVGAMPTFSACEILETREDGWLKIKSGEVEGYVSSRFVVTGKEANELAKDKMETVAIVDCDVLNVRKEPNINSQILTSVKDKEEVEIVEKIDGWLKINKNNLIGYVSADYIKYVTTLPTAIKIQEVTVGAGSSGGNSGGSTSGKFSSKNFATGDQSVNQTVKDLIDYSMQFLGNPYVYGGNSLTNGTDCSGFTKLIFAKFGYTLSRSSSAQVNNGRKIAFSDVRPGDLLFYKYGSNIGHVAIYIGNGQIIHASTPKGGIRIGNALYTAPAYAVRIIE